MLFKKRPYHDITAFDGSNGYHKIYCLVRAHFHFALRSNMFFCILLQNRALASFGMYMSCRDWAAHPMTFSASKKIIVNKVGEQKAKEMLPTGIEPVISSYLSNHTSDALYH